MFQFSLATFTDQATQGLNSPNPDIRQAAQELLNALPKVSQETTINPPTPTTFAQAQQQTLAELGMLLPLVPEDRKHTLEETVQIFQDSIDLLEASGWTAVPAKVSSFSVARESQKVKIPKKDTFSPHHN